MFKHKTLDGILQEFRKTIADLEALADTRLREAAEKRRRSDELAEEAGAAMADVVKANAVKEKIAALIEG